SASALAGARPKGCGRARPYSDWEARPLRSDPGPGDDSIGDDRAASAARPRRDRRQVGRDRARRGGDSGRDRSVARSHGPSDCGDSAEAATSAARVNLVADTHALVWYLSGQLRRLSPRARHAFAQAEAARWTVRIPTVVLMEIVLLERRRRIRVAYGDVRDQ